MIQPWVVLLLMARFAFGATLGAYILRGDDDEDDLLRGAFQPPSDPIALFHIFVWCVIFPEAVIVMILAAWVAQRRG